MENSMESKGSNESVKEKEGSVISEAPADENKYINPDKLRKEIKRIIGNMSDSKVTSEPGDDSVIEEECVKEVKTKERKMENSKRNDKNKRKVDFSSSSDGKVDSLDSARTDVGIPPIPICAPSKPVDKRKLSTLVLDHTSKRKVYVPGKEKSEFFRCPHKKIEYVERNFSFPQLPLKDNYKTCQIMEKQVDRYHYNHFVLRNSNINRAEKNEMNVVDKSNPSGRLTLFRRLKLACLRGKDEQMESKMEPINVEPITIEPDHIENEPICYCGSGEMNQNHHIGDDISSGESLDQIYKVKVDSTTCPTSFIFQAIDREACKRYGEVHFVVDNKQMSEDPILENIRLSKEQSAMLIPTSQQQRSSQPSPTEKEDKSQQIDRFETDEAQQKKPSSKGSIQEYSGKQYRPVRTKPERIDIYMFDHQDTRYFHTTDNPPPVLTEVAVHKVEKVATQFWAEIFSVLHVIFAFLTSFILQTLKFILLAIGRPLTTGVIQIFSDYFLKPLLTITFNGIVQPPIIFVFNIMTSFRDLCRPLASGLGYFVKELAHFAAAIRLCKVSNKTNNGPFVAQPIPSNV